MRLKGVAQLTPVQIIQYFGLVSSGLRFYCSSVSEMLMLIVYQKCKMM